MSQIENIPNFPQPPKFEEVLGVDPRFVKSISYEEYLKNFVAITEEVLDGAVYKVQAFPALEQFAEQYIYPQARANNADYFKPHPPDIYGPQTLQKLLFEDLTHFNHLYVDSSIWIKRTLAGSGGFIGPHIDKYLGLPEYAVNMWISFSKLEEGETVTALPQRWLKKCLNSGQFPPGVWRDQRGLLRPTPELLSDLRISPAVEPCEIILFASGIVPHCSPFNVRKERVTIDLRYYFKRSEDDEGHSTRFDFYPIREMHRFDGKKPVKEVLEQIHQTEPAQAEAALESALLRGPQVFEDEVIGQLSNRLLNPMRVSKFLKKHNYSFSAPMLDVTLQRYPNNLSLLADLLELPMKDSDRVHLVRAVAKLRPISTTYYFTQIVNFVPWSMIHSHFLPEFKKAHGVDLGLLVQGYYLSKRAEKASQKPFAWTSKVNHRLLVALETKLASRDHGSRASRWRYWEMKLLNRDPWGKAIPAAWYDRLNIPKQTPFLSRAQRAMDHCPVIDRVLVFGNLERADFRDLQNFVLNYSLGLKRDFPHFFLFLSDSQDRDQTKEFLSQYELEQNTTVLSLDKVQSYVRHCKKSPKLLVLGSELSPENLKQIYTLSPKLEATSALVCYRPEDEAQFKEVLCEPFLTHEPGIWTLV